jgi:putative protease
MPGTPRILPELLAPAGDWDCARAAVENGADAVYFGLQGGFNARARAANFSLADMPELMTFLRTRGVKGYLALNTLVFDDELAEVERLARPAVAAGVDAVLVQDIGLLRLLHRLCPELPLHASTQMTLSSAECIGQLESSGLRRVVLPRELSIEQIAAIGEQTDVELEAFVHGALCISYSGQCLASLSLGGRSANRGQCAQPCRLPYQLLADSHGEPDAAEMKYPLSPHDLAAYDRLPQLIAAGVAALKIEGRLKPPEYVASVTRHYRQALDAAGQEKGVGASHQTFSAAEIAEMEVAFSRGFGHGWLDGTDPQALVSGRSSAKRGTYLGRVRGLRGPRVAVALAGPVRRGDGVVFEGDRSRAAEPGGRVYEVFRQQRSLSDVVSSGVVELAFRSGAIDPAKIHAGQRVWKTDDPQASRRIRKSYAEGRIQRRVPLDLAIEAAAGSRLRVIATAATGAECRVESPESLPEAAKHPLTLEMLREQFGRLGKTPYELRRLDATIDGRPMIPLSVLGKLRHEIVRRLNAAAMQPPQRTIDEGSALAALRTEQGATNLPSPASGRGAGGEGGAVGTTTTLTSIPNRPHPGPLPTNLRSVPGDRTSASQSEPCLHVLCRSMEQVEAALTCHASSIIVDFGDGDRCPEAVRVVQTAGAKVLLATPRIHKPGQSEVFPRLSDARPDGILARNLAGLAFFRQTDLPAVADFSLNAVNALAVQWLRAEGAERVTPGYDLNRRRLLELAAAVPPEWLEVVIHRHTPMFHAEYCLYCATFSRGKGRRDCGRPCQRHTLRLRDRLGVEHLVLADSQCRNTVFHAEAENLAEALPALRKRGVRHFRVELLAENTAAQVRRLLAACPSLFGKP